MSEVRVNGEHVWKYYGEKKRVSRSPNGIMLFGVLLFFVFTIAGGLLYPIMLKNGVSKSTCSVLSFVALVLAVAVFMIALFSRERKSQGISYAYGRNIYNDLYLFDYSSPIFRNHLKKEDVIFSKVPENQVFRNAYLENISNGINKSGFLEEIMAKGREGRYGNKITEIFFLKEKRRECLIQCYVEGRGVKSLVIPKTYHEYESLIWAFRHLESPKGQDYETFIDNYRKYTKRMVTTGILFLVFAAAAFPLWLQCRAYQSNLYQEVTVTVDPDKDSGDTLSMITQPVTVSYEGKVYVLKDRKKSQFLYKKGEKIQAYLSKGNIYENLDSINTRAPMGIPYGVALFICAAMGILTAELITRRRRILLEYKVEE